LKEEKKEDVNKSKIMNKLPIFIFLTAFVLTTADVAFSQPQSLKQTVTEEYQSQADQTVKALVQMIRIKFLVEEKRLKQQNHARPFFAPLIPEATFSQNGESISDIMKEIKQREKRKTFGNGKKLGNKN
jgi:hypothetical protein